MKKIALFIFLSMIQSAQADPRFFRFKNNAPVLHLEQKQVSEFRRDDYFTQKIDHFSTTDQRTFRQRYFIDSSYAKSPMGQAPVLYYICGESTCGGSGSSEFVNQLAKKLGAHRVALEHRYYGYSQPFKTLESEHLFYLSMGQAIEDLAEFQLFASQNFGLNGKWVAIGGSYSGEVAAFYRMKHPELVVGALASSAPVLAKDKFEEYDQHVARVAGAECLNAIQVAYRDIEVRLSTTSTARAVKRLFNSEIIFNDNDFLYVVADMAAVAIQYGFQKTFCDQITQGLARGKVVEAYAKAGLDLFGRFGISPVQDSFQGAESVDPNDYLGWAGMRSWMYQSCTEFGYYQVAFSVPAYSARSARISLSYHNGVCKRLFGINIPVDVKKTNSQYYQQLFNSNVRNIFFTNGANDPWSLLSITESNPDSTLNPGLQYFKIANAAHCEDLGGGMSVYLEQARNQFSQLVSQWINEKSF